MIYLVILAESLCTKTDSEENGAEFRHLFAVYLSISIYLIYIHIH